MSEMIERENYKLLKWADLESEPSTNNSTRWFGTYRGIRFEIQNYKREDSYRGVTNDCWTHYVWLAIDDQLPYEMAEKFWLKPRYDSLFFGGPERVYYDYYDSIISSLEFHGGCTWYSKESSVDDKKRQVKIGCDYQHLWDDGQTYSLGDVHSEVKETIDSLWKLIPDIKVRSRGDGKYYLLSEYETQQSPDQTNLTPQESPAVTKEKE